MSTSFTGLGVPLAQHLSVKNKLISSEEDQKLQGEENEWLIQNCRRKLETTHYDYFVFGHRHLSLEIALNDKSTYINLGDWVSHYTFAELDGTLLTLKSL